MAWLLRLLFLLGIAYLVVSGVRKLLLPPQSSRKNNGKEKEQAGIPMVQDPQCGRFVLEQEASRTAVRGQVVYFCSPECRDLYLSPKTSSSRH